MSEDARLFPNWQPTWAEYTAVCRHLGLSPQPSLYARLLAHLAGQALARPLSPWARHLCTGQRGRLWLCCMDLYTRLFLPTHPVRYWLNAVLALHECTAQGHAELSRVPRGRALWLTLPLWGLRTLGQAILAMPWLAWRALGYALRLRWRAPLQRLTGRCVLVTGAARGLGRDLMLAALEHGARVVAVVRARDHLPAPLDTLPARAPVTWVEADLALPGALPRALAAAGIEARTIDYALLAAGVKVQATVLNVEAVRQTFQVDLFANVEFAGWYHAQGGQGRLALVSSMGRWHGMPGTGGYNAAKAALSIWGESVEMELTSRRVLIVEPGLFASGMVGSRGLQGWLSVPRRQVAERILQAVVRGRRSLRPPLWFAWLTWGLCLGGRALRARVLTAARGG
ncbi:MAG: SDR family NAD(P)-dependent oxidoreductase [Thiobacillaceae bacterium]|nr:SDR family NAD(P)-dependent oxidoreductase [Thiobacillaceae bacterium]MDW8322994.1 SDR family NAD(P)-dependent oxidoreductase [Burkholderiales bacterium]